MYVKYITRYFRFYLFYVKKGKRDLMPTEMFDLINATGKIHNVYDAGINYPQQTVRVHCRRRRPRPLYFDDACAEVYI